MEAKYIDKGRLDIHQYCVDAATRYYSPELTETVYKPSKAISEAFIDLNDTDSTVTDGNLNVPNIPPQASSESYP